MGRIFIDFTEQSPNKHNLHDRIMNALAISLDIQSKYHCYVHPLLNPSISFFDISLFYPISMNVLHPLNKAAAIAYILTDILVLYTITAIVCTYFYDQMPKQPLDQKLTELINTQIYSKIESCISNITCNIEHLFILILTRILIWSLHSKDNIGYLEMLLLFFKKDAFQKHINGYGIGKLLIVAAKGLLLTILCCFICFFATHMSTDNITDVLNSCEISLVLIILGILIILYAPEMIKWQYYWYIMVITSLLKIGDTLLDNQKIAHNLNNAQLYSERYDSIGIFFTYQVRKMIEDRNLNEKIFIVQTESADTNHIRAVLQPIGKNYIVVHCHKGDTTSEKHLINTILIWQLLYLDKKPVFCKVILERLFLALIFLIFRWINNTFIDTCGEEEGNRKWKKAVLMIITMSISYTLYTLCENAFNHFLIHITNKQFMGHSEDIERYKEWLITNYYVCNDQPMYFPSFLMLLSSDKPNIYSYLKALEKTNKS